MCKELLKMSKPKITLVTLYFKPMLYFSDTVSIKKLHM